MGEQTIDELYVSMPQHPGIRHFKNGISVVAQWTGKELKEMAKVLLLVISDANTRVVQAARAVLDFMYLAHSLSLTDDELESMDQCSGGLCPRDIYLLLPLGPLHQAIHTFHKHKEIFEQNNSVTTEKGFHGIPKIHVNATKQMALYIQCREAIAMHAAHIAVAHPLYYGNMGNNDDEIDEDSGDEDDVDDKGDGESEEDDQRDADPEEEQYEWDDCNIRVVPMVDLESFCRQSGGCWEKDIVEQP
ncbi:hypothetical protein BDV93DRAFT_515681 [Ceratobasidium sp. AG-I]|nr:hypothetical protein BDV93DRAFT_515681 [Ceratobasidium sp. AG-I]